MTVGIPPQNDLPECIRCLLSGPPDGHKDPAVQRIYAMAAGIRRAAGEAPLCLGSASREVIAASLLAALAGGPPVILPPDFTAPVLAAIHRETGFEILLAAPRTPGLSFCRSMDPAGLRTAAPLAASDGTKAPADLWVHLYTGGSTGAPRCWSKTVANLLGEAVFQARRISLAPADLVLSTVPAHHIYGLLFTVLAPLAAGARVVGGSPVFPAEIAAALDETGATVLVSVPAHYRLLADRLSRGTMLRLALSSAAPLPAADAEAFFLATGVPLEEVYGSTETGGIATRCRARGETALTPLTGLDWRIRDGHLRVRSPFLSPELPRDREGFFHTADRVAAVDAGGFVIRGRSDGIVKIAGRRVDLESVRRRILAIRGVREAVVFARPSEGGRQTEILALVQTSLAAAVIRARLQAELPAWAVPRTIRVTDRIPLAATGKFDRQAVAALFRGMERK